MCVCVYKDIFMHRKRFGRISPQTVTCGCLGEVEEEEKTDFPFLLIYFSSCLFIHHLKGGGGLVISSFPSAGEGGWRRLSGALRAQARQLWGRPIVGSLGGAVPSQDPRPSSARLFPLGCPDAGGSPKGTWINDLGRELSSLQLGPWQSRACEVTRHSCELFQGNRWWLWPLPRLGVCFERPLQGRPQSPALDASAVGKGEHRVTGRLPSGTAASALVTQSFAGKI